MAALGTSGLTGVILSMLMAERINSQINREVVLLNLLPVKLAGDPMSWAVKFRGRTAAAGIAETAAAPVATSDVRVQASLVIGEYSDTAGVTGKAEAAAALALNPMGVAGGEDLMADELSDSIGNVAESLANHVYSGTGGATDPIIGLATAVAATGTYAGINRATYPEWASVADTGSLAAISKELLRTSMTNIRTACGKRVNLAVCTPALLDRIKSLDSTYPAYVSSIPINGVDKKLVSGSRAVYIEDCWFVDDPRCTANVIYLLNTDHIAIRSMPQFTSAKYAPDVIAAEMSRLTGTTIRAEEAAALMGKALSSGIVSFIKRLGPTGNQENNQVIVYPQLQLIGCKFHGKLTLS